MYQYSTADKTYYVNRVNNEIFFYAPIGDELASITVPAVSTFPLYKPEQFKLDNSAVFCCESEAEADRLIELGYVATTFCHAMTDWKPLEKHRIIFTGDTNRQAMETLLGGKYKAFALLDTTSISLVPDDELKAFVERYRPDSLPCVCLLDLEQAAYKEPKMILDLILREGSIMMLAAPPGIGKTWLMLGMVHAIAGDSEFLRWKSQNRRRVVVFDYELRAWDLQQRNRHYINEQGYIPKDYLRFVNREQLLQSNRKMPKLSDPWDREVIYNTIRDSDVAVFDTLSRASMEDEVKVEGWKPIEDYLLDVCAEGKSIVLIHHTNAGGLKQRGTSAHEDSLETNILLEKIEDKPPNAGAAFMVKYPKTRAVFGEKVDPFAAYLIHDAEQNKSFWRYDTLRAEEIRKQDEDDVLKDQIKKMLKDGFSGREIQKMLKIGYDKYAKLIKSIKNECALGQFIKKL